MDIEEWVQELFSEIESEAEHGGNYDLHLEKEMVQELANAIRSAKWIEIY